MLKENDNKKSTVSVTRIDGFLGEWKAAID